MKKTYITILACLLSGLCAASADQPVYAADYSFVTYSARRQAYASQAVLATTNGTIQTRFHVFDATSGQLLWQSSTNYGMSGQVHLAPDPDYVVSVNSYFSNRDLRRIVPFPQDIISSAKREDHTVLTVNTNITTELQNQWLSSVWAVRVYRRGQLLQSYTLADLEFPLAFVQFSVSHGDFARLAPQFVPKWRDDPFASMFDAGANPRFAGNRVFLECLDGMTRVFELKTGKLMEAKETERLQQDAAHIFQKPRAVSENGER